MLYNSNGVRIATEKRCKVRAVFEGEVLAVIVIKICKPCSCNTDMVIILLHIKNLSKVYSKKGDKDKISTKQVIGEVFTDKR